MSSCEGEEVESGRVMGRFTLSVARSNRRVRSGHPPTRRCSSNSSSFGRLGRRRSAEVRRGLGVGVSEGGSRMRSRVVGVLQTLSGREQVLKASPRGAKRSSRRPRVILLPRLALRCRSERGLGRGHGATAGCLLALCSSLALGSSILDQLLVVDLRLLGQHVDGSVGVGRLEGSVAVVGSGDESNLGVLLTQRPQAASGEEQVFRPSVSEGLSSRLGLRRADHGKRVRSSAGRNSKGGRLFRRDLGGPATVHGGRSEEVQLLGERFDLTFASAHLYNSRAW